MLVAGFPRGLRVLAKRDIEKDVISATSGEASPP
jgi:hypothetical protein